MKVLPTRRVSPFLLLVGCLLATAGAVLAQATALPSEADILSQLQNRPLFLRGCWKEDQLLFDHQGSPSKPYKSQSVTLCGIDVQSARFRSGFLELGGQRIGLVSAKEGAWVRVPMKWSGYKGKVTIQIAGNSTGDFGPALQAVFAPDLQAVVPSLQVYWRSLGKHFLSLVRGPSWVPEGSPELQADPAPQGRSPSANSAQNSRQAVKPPVLLSAVDPEYSDAARGMAYSAKVEIYLWIDTQGLPCRLEVKKPAGLGLDEQAMAAAARYRFKPAMLNGAPVKVDLYVDVNFSAL